MGPSENCKFSSTVGGEGTETRVCCCHAEAEHRALPGPHSEHKQHPRVLPYPTRITWFLPRFPAVVPGVARPKRESRDEDNGMVSPRPCGQPCRRLPGEGGGARGWQQFVGLV